MWKNIFGTKYDGNAVNEYKKGDDALGRDDYVAAISCFKEAIDIEPNFAEAYHSLGCAYFGINSAEDAIRSLETAIKLKCKGPNIYFYLGIAYISVGKEPYGRELINKAVGLGSKSAKLWVDKRESIKKAMPDYIKNCQIFYNYHYDLFGNSSCKTMIEYWQTNTEANETFSELSDQIAKLCMKDYELNYRELIRKAFPGLTDEFINHNEEIIKKARKDVRILMHCNYDEPTFDVQNIPTCSKQMAFDKAHKSVEYLGLQAYEIFMQEYKSSEMIQSTIQKYSEYLAIAQMKMFHYEDTKNEVIEEFIKPLNTYYDDLFSNLFNLLQRSLLTHFPKRDYHIHNALLLYDDDTKELVELQNAIAKAMANKLQSEFVLILYSAIKTHYEIVLKKYYPKEYAFFLSYSKDNIEELWREIYGRAVEIVYNCLTSLGLKLKLFERDKILYGPTIEGMGISIENSEIIGGLYSYSSIVIDNLKNKNMDSIKIDAGVKVSDNSSVDSIISKPTVVVGNNNKVVSDGDNNDVLQSISGLINDIKSSSLEYGDNFIILLQELKQAIETENTNEQIKAKQKFSDFWMALSPAIKKNLKGSNHLTKVLDYLEIEKIQLPEQTIDTERGSSKDIDWTKWGVFVAILTVVVTIIASWEQLRIFFNF